MRYAIRRISLTGALFYGLLLGLVGWLIPGALLGWLARSAVVGLRDWLAAFQLTIPLPLGEGLALDLTPALPLGDAQARLAALAAQETALMLAVMIGVAAAGMLLTGLIAFIGALVYNLLARVFGGVQMTLDALDALDAPAPVSAAREPVKATPAPVVAARPRPEPAGNARPTPLAWLTIAGDGERRALGNDVTRIGSAPENDIVLVGLAPQHAEIRRESGRYLIYDLGSRRTWVNDTQVATVQMLKDGSRVQMGQVELWVHIPTNQQTAVEER